MYDKKQALGFILIIMVVMTYTQFVFAPYQPPPQKAAEPSENNPTSSLGEHNNTSNLSQKSASNNEPVSNKISAITARIPTLEEIAQAPKTTIKNGVATLVITHLGARLQSLELNSIHKELNGTQEYNLISPTEGMSLPLGLQMGSLSDEAVVYQIKDKQGFQQPESEDLVLSNSESASITFGANLSNGKSVTKTFTFKAKSYLFDVQATVSPAVDTTDPLTLTWPTYVNPEALHQSYDPYFFSILSDSNKVTHFQAISDLSELKTLNSANWISFGDRYFGIAMLPKIKNKNVRIDADQGNFVLYARGEPNSIEVNVFAGPKIYQLLKNQGLQLERTIDLGFFSVVAYPLLQLLKFLFQIFGNYGVAIVALTLIVKTIFYPLNKASLNSMKAMQELAPEIAALKERVKDPTQLNQETLALYKRKGVNPVGGCLPVFIQIPVFFGLYSALQNAVELRHAPFALWIKDLATPEKLQLLGINVPVLVLTMGTIMFVQQYRTPMPNMDATQRKVTLGMSVMFTFMFLIFPFPAGLALYMLVNTTISLVQQQCIRSVTMNKPFQMTLVASAAILVTAFIFSKL